MLRKLFNITKKILKRGLIAGLAVALVILLGNLWMIGTTKHLIHDDIAKIPYNDVGLVLGTSNKYASGRINYFFKRRVEAAASLFKAKKVKHLIVSGDNSLDSYNEPREMHRALVRLGIPDSCITLDFAGFRTLDSVVRSKKVFQQDKITVISQKFHNYRAVYIGKHYDMDLVAYNARKVGGTKRTYVRESLARLKAILDIHILRKQPKFLGEKIDIIL